MTLKIDGQNIPVNMANLRHAIDGGVTRSATGTIFNNEQYYFTENMYQTIQLPKLDGLNIYRYLLNNGECFDFSSDDVYWTYSNKGNYISDIISGTIAQVSTAGFANLPRCLQISAGGEIEFSTELGEKWTVIVQWTPLTTNRGDWYTFVKSSAHANDAGIFGTTYASSGIGNLQYIIKVVAGRLRLLGKDSADGNLIGYFNRLIILKEEINLSNSFLGGVSGQAGNASGVTPYIGEYPKLVIEDFTKKYIGKSDPSNLELRHDYGTSPGDTNTEVSFNLIEDA